jgi:hypothetical protein
MFRQKKTAPDDFDPARYSNTNRRHTAAQSFERQAKLNSLSLDSFKKGEKD